MYNSKGMRLVVSLLVDYHCLDRKDHCLDSKLSLWAWQRLLISVGNDTTDLIV